MGSVKKLCERCARKLLEPLGLGHQVDAWEKHKTTGYCEDCGRATFCVYVEEPRQVDAFRGLF